MVVVNVAGTCWAEEAAHIFAGGTLVGIDSQLTFRDDEVPFANDLVAAVGTSSELLAGPTVAQNMLCFIELCSPAHLATVAGARTGTFPNGWMWCRSVEENAISNVHPRPHYPQSKASRSAKTRHGSHPS